MDWRLSGQSDQLPESGPYASTITIKDASGNVSGTQRGNVIIEPAREGLELAPPLNPWSAERLMRKWDADQGVKARTGSAELFFYQDRHQGLLGTASDRPLGIRTTNLNRLWIARDGNVGIHTTNPGSPLIVAGMIEVPRFRQSPNLA